MASTTTCLEALGPNPNLGTVLVNNATVGVFVAVATCKGALSFATTTLAIWTAATMPKRDNSPAAFDT